jgi:hypothetical protein
MGVSRLGHLEQDLQYGYEQSKREDIEYLGQEVEY